MARRHAQKDGRKLFEQDRAAALANPKFKAIYEQEASQKELWLQLVEARQARGLTQQQVAERMGVSQAQIARIEKWGYEAYTLRTLRRYLAALGDQFSLRIAIEH